MTKQKETVVPKPKKAKVSKNYFTQDTEDAILEYLASTDQVQRNIIYKTRINYAFNKLVENLIHKYKFYHYEVSYEDAKHETITFFIEKLNKYSQGKGKAYSYFTIVGRNYLIAKNKGNYNVKKIKADLSVVDDTRNVINEVHNSDAMSELQVFFNIFIKYCDDNINVLFTRKRDIQIANSVLELFRRREYIENFNKKALYISIREMTDANTHDVTKIVTILKHKFEKMYSEYMHNPEEFVAM